MWETMLVILAVGVAAVVAGRSWHRTLAGKERKCSGCTDCRCHQQADTTTDQTHHCH